VYTAKPIGGTTMEVRSFKIASAAEGATAESAAERCPSYVSATEEEKQNFDASVIFQDCLDECGADTCTLVD